MFGCHRMALAIAACLALAAAAAAAPAAAPAPGPSNGLWELQVLHVSGGCDPSALAATW